MAKQLHKSFSDQQVRVLLKRYDDREVELRHILGVLRIGRSRFFKILRELGWTPLSGQREGLDRV
jgi:hypothetical protein